jgi:hypothetical protein
MKKLLFFTLPLFLFNFIFAQTKTINIGATASSFDSTFVIQTGQIDSFYSGNHPGAGPYSNAEIFICANATLKYGFWSGTSSQPTFYLEENARLELHEQGLFCNIYMKNGAIVDGGGFGHYISIKRTATADTTNFGNGSSTNDSVFTSLNYTFSNWPGAVSPCNTLNSNSNLNNSVDKISIYPNPVSDILYVTLTNQGCNKLKIYNSYGVLINEYNSFDKNELTLNLTTLPKGLYFLLEENNSNRNRKFFIKN